MPPPCSCCAAGYLALKDWPPCRDGSCQLHSASVSLQLPPCSAATGLQPVPHHRVPYAPLKAAGKSSLGCKRAHSRSAGERLRERDSPPSVRPAGPRRPQAPAPPLPAPSMLLPNALGLASDGRLRLLRGLLLALPPACLGLPPGLPLGLLSSIRGSSVRGLHHTKRQMVESARALLSAPRGADTSSVCRAVGHACRQGCHRLLTAWVPCPRPRCLPGRCHCQMAAAAVCDWTAVVLQMQRPQSSVA